MNRSERHKLYSTTIGFASAALAPQKIEGNRRESATRRKRANFKAFTPSSAPRSFPTIFHGGNPRPNCCFDVNAARCLPFSRFSPWRAQQVAKKDNRRENFILLLYVAGYVSWNCVPRLCPPTRAVFVVCLHTHTFERNFECEYEFGWMCVCCILICRITSCMGVKRNWNSYVPSVEYPTICHHYIETKNKTFFILKVILEECCILIYKINICLITYCFEFATKKLC